MVSSSNEDGNPKCDTLDNRTSKYMKQKLMELKRGVVKFIAIIGDFKTTFSVTDKTNRKIQAI